MRFFRTVGAGFVGASLVACGIGSDIDDYASADGSGAAKAGASGASAAGKAGTGGIAGGPSAGAGGASKGGSSQAGGGQAGAVSTGGAAGVAGQAGGQAGVAGQAGGTAAGSSGASGSKATGGAGAGGAGAGGAGTGGQATGGSAGQSNAGQGGGGSAGSGGATMGLIGLPCNPSDTFTCFGAAQSVVLKCTAGIWQNAISCAEGKLCDGSLGATVGDRCAPIVPECQGQAPGATVCKGADRITCGADLVTSTTKTCGSPTLCALGTGPNCAACEPGTFSCNGTELSKCGPMLTFAPVMTCASAAQCNAASGACTASVCVPGTYTCQGSTLAKCDPMGANYLMVQPCGAGLCDAANAQCDNCQASTATCANGGTRSTCSADGQMSVDTACPAATPFCVGSGTCVECRASTDCPLPSSPCLARACNSGVCAIAPKPAGTPAKNLLGDCKAGTCNGLGGFQDDLLDVPMPDANPCTEASCDPGPTQAPAHEGVACATQSVCMGGVCTCVPKTKVEACYNASDGAPMICGTAPDGCGGSWDCGTCPGTRTCCPGQTSCTNLSGQCLAI